MTIFRLNFLLKVGQMKVCQNPSFISTVKFVCSSLFTSNPKNPKQTLPNISKLTHLQTASARNTIQNLRKTFHICLNEVYPSPFYYTKQSHFITSRHKFVLSTKNILNYIFITKNDINPKLPNTEPTEYPT